MQNNQLPDTPWHVGFVKKEETDPRRHKSRCIHIHDDRCKVYGEKCHGSAHCKYYAENKSQWEDVYLSTRTAEQEAADNYLERMPVWMSMNVQESYEVEEIGNKPHIFSGTEAIRVKDIKLTQEYSSWKPNEEEYIKLLDYYEQYHKMDRPIVVELIKGKYVLKDNYLQFYVSSMLKKKWIKATMNIRPYHKVTKIKKK